METSSLTHLYGGLMTLETLSPSPRYAGRFTTSHALILKHLFRLQSKARAVRDSRLKRSSEVGSSTIFPDGWLSE
ncbi:MAG: hypothetical protein WBG86_22725 [Polyangiales bacterium]